MEAAGSTHVPPGATRDRAPKPRSAPRGPLLRIVSDERLVARVRAGSEAAFTVLWERYHRQLLSYCRHMLGSHHEAEDAVQQVFANAYRDMVRSDRPLRVRPWLYRIARNQCISTLRSRRPVDELDDEEPARAGLSDQLEGRADLRDLLRDLAALPAAQREALLLAELHDNSHADVAEIVGCDREKVKSLVFQARASLISARQAREASCEEIQRQLSVLRGGSLRRGLLRRHLADCEACRLFHAEVKRQRAALAIVLPVTPVGVLKLGAASALAASGGTAAGGGAAAGSGVAAGSAATLAAKLGVSAALVKGTAATVAVTTVVAGGAATVQVARDAQPQRPPAAAQAAGDAGKPPAGLESSQAARAGLPAGGRRGEARRSASQMLKRARMRRARARRAALVGGRGAQRTGPQRTRLQRRRAAERAGAVGKHRPQNAERRSSAQRQRRRDARERPSRRPLRERPRRPERTAPPTTETPETPGTIAPSPPRVLP
jgi:RNA polymerase sigma factor (sigma-70 family)